MPQSGAFDLANALLGGNQASAQDAFYKGQTQHATIEHLSAQTQDALANAKLSQSKAKKAEQEQQEGDKLADALFGAGLAKTPEEAQSFATIARGGFANFPQLVEGRGGIKKQGYTDTVADQNAPLDARLAASSGIQGKVQVSPEGEDQAIRRYKFGETLTDPTQRSEFKTYAQPEKIFSAGGVPYSGGGSRAVRPLVSAEEAATNAEATSRGKKLGAGEAARTLDLPRATQHLADSATKLDSMSALATQIQSDPQLWQGVDLTQAISKIPGTAGAKIRAQLNTLKSKVAFAVLQDMRDNSKTGGALGQVSNYEDELLANNIAALDANLSVQDFRDQLGILIDYAHGAKERVTKGYFDTYPELKQSPTPAPNSGAGTTPTFKTEAEAEAAGIKPGTKVVIGGISGTWQ